jgi:hypothetical protein
LADREVTISYTEYGLQKAIPSLGGAAKTYNLKVSAKNPKP